MKIKKFLIVSIFTLINSGLIAQNIHFTKYDGVEPTMRTIRIASASVVTDKWEKEVNWSRIERMVRLAALEGGANIVVTPEGALDGYVINEVNSRWETENDSNILERFFQLGEPINGPYIKKAISLSNELNIYLILGFLELDDEYLFNTAILIDPDGDIIGRYRKTHFAQGYTVNPEFYKAGNSYPVFQTTFGKVGILICYDRQLPEPARILALNGAEILFVPSYGGYSEEGGWNSILLRTRARENNIPLVFCHPYQSLLIRDDGEISVIGNGGDLSYYEIRVSKDKNNIMRNRRPEIYNKLVDPE